MAGVVGDGGDPGTAPDSAHGRIRGSRNAHVADGIDVADKAQVSLADIGRSRFSPVRLLVCVALVLVAVIAPYWLGRMMAVKHTEGIVALLSAVRPQGVAFVAWTVTVVGLTGLAMAVIESRSWLWRAVFVVGLSAEQFIAGMSLLKFEFWHSTRVVYGDAAPLLDAANWGILAAGYAVAVYAVVFVGLLVIVRKDSPLNVLTRSWASFILFYLIEAVALLIVLFGGLLALG